MHGMQYNMKGVAGLLLFIGILQFLFSLMAAEFLYPGYSVSQNYISDLGATCRSTCQIFQPSSSIFHTIFSVIVFFSMAFAAIFSYRVTKMPLKIISALLGLFTLSFIFLYIGK